MSSIQEFFSTWGWIPVSLKNHDSIATKERWVAKNLADYIPIVGLLSAARIGLQILLGRHVQSLSIETKAGLITHSLIGGIGGGLFCFTADAITSLIHAIQNRPSEQPSSGSRVRNSNKVEGSLGAVTSKTNEAGDPDSVTRDNKVYPNVTLSRVATDSAQAARLSTEPYQFYKEIQTAKETGIQPFPFHPSFYFLRLCPCKKLNTVMRTRLEEWSLELINRQVPKNHELHVVSVGPGAAYQELVYVAKLVAAGYRQIKFVMIEPADFCLKAFQVVCQSFFPEATVQTTLYKDFETYERGEAGKSIDLLLLLDLTDKKYEIDGQQLSEYAFTRQQRANALTQRTAIAYSTVELDKDTIIAKGVSCRYDDHSSLATIEADKHVVEGERETMVKISGLGDVL